MKACLVASLVLCATVAGSCSNQGTVAPTAPPPSAVQSSVVATLPVPAQSSASTPAPPLTAAGWLIYLRGGDLYVGALDGSREQRLTSGETRPEFAGYVRDGAHTTWVYYTTFGQQETDGRALVRMNRQSVDGAAKEELFTFEANAQEWALSEPIATISPDGLYVAYTDERGLRLYDVSARSDRSLLSNMPQSASNTPGNVYLRPVWAPAGGWLAVTRTGYPPYDKPTLDFIRPLEPVTEYTADAGGAFRAWSADGTRMCASQAGFFNKGYTFDDVDLVTPGQAQVQILMHHATIDNPGGVPTVIAPNACAWIADGRVAVSYLGGQANVGAVTILSGTGATLSYLQMQGTFDIAGWLPDGSAVIRGVEDPGLGNQNIVLMLDGSIRSLPFSPERILAVIPPP